MTYEEYKAKRNAERQAGAPVQTGYEAYKARRQAERGLVPKVETFEEYKKRRNAERKGANLQSSANSVGETVNADYISSYFTDADKFLQGMVQDQQIGHWDYMTNPFTVKERDQKLQELTAKSQNVRKWFEQNRDYMDEEEYGKYVTYLDALEQDMTSAKDYYSSLGKYSSQEEYKAAVKRSDWQRQYMDTDMLLQAQRLEQLQQNGGSQAMIDDTKKKLQSSAGSTDLSKVTQRMKELTGTIQIAKGKGQDTTVLEQEYADLSNYYSWILNNKYLGEYEGMSYADLQSAIVSQEQFVANAGRLDESIWARNNTTLQQEQEKLAWLKQYAPTRKTSQDHIRENEETIADMKADLQTLDSLAKVDWEKEGEFSDALRTKYGIPMHIGYVRSWLKEQCWYLENANKYNYLSENADFESLSQYNEAIGKKDQQYWVINNTAETTVAQDTIYAKYINMEPYEVRTYNYVYATQGKAAAKEYLKSIESSLDTRWQEEWSERIEAEVENTPAVGLLASSADFFLGIPTGIEYIGKSLWRSGKELVTGKIQAPVSMSSLGLANGTLGSNLSSATVSYIEDNYDGFAEDTLKAGYHVTNGLIQTGLQFATSEFLIGIGVNPATASNLTAVLTSGGAYTSSVIDAKSRGASDEQAMIMGVTAGLAEWFFEKYEIDEILNTNRSAGRDFVNNMVKEFVGEGATTFANLATDTIVMQDLSQFNMLVQQYEEQLAASGKSNEEIHKSARKQAIKDLAKQVGYDALIGGLSGGIAGSIKGVVNSVNTKRTFGQHVPQMVDSVLTVNPQDDIALAIKEKLDNGKTVSAEKIYAIMKRYPKIAAQVIRGESQIQLPSVSPAEAPDEIVYPKPGQAFTGRSGTTWNQQQAELLAAIPDDVLKKAESWIGRYWPLFDKLDMDKDTEAQKAWKRAGLTWDQLGFTFIKVEALKDEIARRKGYAAQIAKRKADAKQIITSAKQAYENGNMSKEYYDGMVAAAQQYTQPAPQQPTAGTNTPQTVPQQPISGTNVPQTGTQTINALNGGYQNVTTETGNLPGRSSQRNAGQSAAGQADSLARGTRKGSASADHARAAIQRQNTAKDIRKVSSKEIGVQSGTDTANIKVLPVESWDTELQAIADRVKQQTGKEVTFVLGTIEVRGAKNKITNVRGVINEAGVIIQADNMRVTPEQIADHEIYHDYAKQDRSLNRMLRRYIEEKYSPEAFATVLDKYIVGLGDLINIPEDPSSRAYEAAMDAVIEEILADAYAGINVFSAHAEMFTDAATERTDQLGYGKYSTQSNGTRQTAGPPSYVMHNKNTTQSGGEKYSINSDFYKQIDNWDGKTIGFSFVVGETSQALQEAGVPQKQIRWDASKIATLLAKHNGMTIETVKQIPGLLEHPVIVIDSKQNQNARIIMGEVYDEHGNIVTGVLLLTPTSKKGNVLDYFKISSAEGRGHIKSLFTNDDGTPVAIRYVDKKRIQSWLNVNRLQLPLHNLDLDSTDMVSHEADDVKGESVEHFSVDDSDTATYPDAATQELVEKLRNLSPTQMMGDGVHQVLNQYIKRTEPQPKPTKIEVDKGNLKKALSSTLGLNKEQKKQLKGILDEYTEQVKQPARKRGARKQVDPVAESKPIKAKKLLRDKLTGLFSIPEGERAELGAYIDAFADRIVKDGKLTEEDRKVFFDHLYELGVMTVPADEYYREGRAYLLDSRIYVDESVRAEFGDDWESFRRRAWGAGIYLTNDPSNRSIDQWNVDLSNDIPGVFSSEETDRKTILERIVQIAQEGKDEKVSLAEYTKILAGEEYVSEAEVLDDMERKMDEALRSFAESANLEISLRDREGRRIAKERAARMEAARLQKDQREMRELQQKTLKTLQWLSKNRNKAPEDQRAKWDEVLSDIDIYAIGAANSINWSEKHNATWKDLARIYKEASAYDPNFLPSTEIEKIVSRLDDRKIEEMDFDALQDLYKAAYGIMTEFQNRHKVLNDEKQRQFAEVYKKSKSEIETASGKYKGTGGDKFANIEMLSPMSILQRMAGWNPDSTFFSMARQLENGERDQRAFIVKANRILEDFIKDHQDWIKTADGQGKDAIWYTVEIPELDYLEYGEKPVFGRTVKVHMTPAQKVHMYLESKNYDNLRHMTGGRTFVDKELYSKGKREEAFARGTKVKLAPETVKKLVSDLTPEEQALADALTEYYNTFAKSEINRVSNVLYGYDKAMGSFYAPIYTDQNYTNHESGLLDVTAEGVGNLKSRQYAKNPTYNISAFEAFEKCVYTTSRFVSMAIPARNWNTLLNWTEAGYADSMRNTIAQKWGNDGIRYIEDILTKLQAGSKSEYDSISTFTDKLLSNYISSVFAFNPGIVLKQLGSIHLASAYLGGKNFPLTKLFTKNRKIISQYTQELDWRTMGYSTPELKHLKDNPNLTQTNKTMKFLFGGGAITVMDGWAAKILWPWAENKVRRDFPDLQIGTQEQIGSGNSPFYKKVAEVFEYALNRSQSVSDEMHQGRLRKSKNPVTRTFTMFKSDSAQVYNTLRQKIGELKYFMKNGTAAQKKAAVSALSNTVLAFLGGTLYAEVISFAMALWKNKAKYYREEDEEITFANVKDEILWGWAENMAGIVTGGDALVQMLEGIFSDDAWWSNFEAPGLAQFNEIYDKVVDSGKGLAKAVAALWSVVENDGDVGQWLKQHASDFIGGIKDIAQTAATYLFGIPAGNIEAYLLGTFKWLSPELATAYEDALKTAEKSDLKGMSGKALEYRIGSILKNRNVTEDDYTAQILTELYEDGYTEVIPSDTPDNMTINGEDQKLSAYQQQVYDQTWAEVVADALDDLVVSEGFEGAESAEDQAKMIKNLYSYASEIAKAEVFDDHEISSGAEKFKAALDMGLTAAEYLEAKYTYDSIGEDKSITASSKATQFAYWVDNQDYTKKQGDFIKENLRYWMQTPAEASNYEKFSGAGFDEKTALALSDALAQLEPEEGKKQVSDQQKWRTVIQTVKDQEQQMAALQALMTEKQYAKLEVACDKSIIKNNKISPELWVLMMDILPLYDENGNGRYSQREIKLAINGLSDDMGSRVAAGWAGITIKSYFKYLEQKEKAVLWQLLTNDASYENNPFNTQVGKKVQKAYEALTETDE